MKLLYCVTMGESIQSHAAAASSSITPAAHNSSQR